MQTSTATPLRAWLVPHTHWDREWYATADDLRVRLARMLDEALDELEQDDRLHFTLDGQSLVVEDYLSLRPGARERLVSLLRSRRVVMGPMYAITDEHLVGAESLVRNFALGAAQCRDLGVEPMALCYAPDTFAHVAQLPQLLRGFGLRAIVFTRGLGAELARHGAVLAWEGADGSDVLAIQQPGGYSAAHQLGYLVDGADRDAIDADAVARNAADQVLALADRTSAALERSGVSQLLLSSGVDHGALQRDLAHVLDAAGAQLPGVETGITTYEGYLEAVEAELRSDPDALAGLARVAGELPGGLDSHQLRGVASARIPIKQANERAERELYVAEVVAALAQLAEERLPPLPGTPFAPPRRRAPRLRAELDWAWRELLKNHAHDSIWGSSTDEVHHDMDQRFRTARHVARRVIRIAVSMLGGEPERYDYQPLSATLPRLPVGRPAVAFLNPLAWRRTEIVGMRVPAELLQERQLHAIVGGVTRPVQVVRHQRTATSRFAADSADPGYLRHVDLAQTPADVEALVQVDCAGFGSSRVQLEAGEGGDLGVEPARALDGRTIANGDVELRADADGQVVVTHRASGVSLGGMLVIHDAGDRGDEYTFDPVPGDAGWRSTDEPGQVRIVEDGPLRATLEVRMTARLPRGIGPDRATRSAELVDVPIVLALSLHAGSDRVRCSVHLHNRACDHRLQLAFATGGHVEEVRAEAAFTVERRPARFEPVDGRWPVHQTTGAVCAGSVVVAGRGLHEYEVVQAGEASTLRLTMLRSVGWLSRNDLVARPFGAGPSYPTPDAQCLGEHRVELDFAVCPTPPSDGDLLRFAQEAAVEFVECADSIDVSGLLAVDGAPDVVVTMLKQADDGDGVVLRGVHAADRVGELRISAPGHEVGRARLDETPGRTEADPAAVRAREIFTRRIR